jgi:uncharacterized protein involved in response to NO
MNAVARLSRAYSGPALFNYGFRPFFLLGAAHAALVMVAWPLFYGELSLRTTFAPRDWHAHELSMAIFPRSSPAFCSPPFPTGRAASRFRALRCSALSWRGSWGV